MPARFRKGGEAGGSSGTVYQAEEFPELSPDRRIPLKRECLDFGSQHFPRPLRGAAYEIRLHLCIPFPVNPNMGVPAAVAYGVVAELNRRFPCVAYRISLLVEKAVPPRCRQNEKEAGA